MQLSILICTRNRAAELEQTLKAAIASIAPISDSEVLVIDNGSSDNTRTVVSESQTLHPHVRYHYINDPGLSNARNIGLALTDGEIVAFIDDDATPVQNWASHMLAAFSNPEVMAVGGRTILEWSEPKPGWFPSEFECYLAPYDLGDESREVTAEHYPVGANMAFRRSAFTQLGGFDLRLGYTGEAKVGWEDIEMFSRIGKTGGKIVYAPEALVHHKVGPEKLTRSYVKRRLFAEGYGYVFYDFINTHPSKDEIRAKLLVSLRDVAGCVPFHMKWFLKHGKLEYKYKMDTLRKIGTLCALTRWWWTAHKYTRLEWAGKASLVCQFRPNIELLSFAE